MVRSRSSGVTPQHKRTSLCHRLSGQIQRRASDTSIPSNALAAELLAQIDQVADGAAFRDGWRGLIDFGEVWSESDADLAWPPGAGNVPVGEPLVYGCEVTPADSDTEHVRVRFLTLDSLRPVMVLGARFTLRDGATQRATGRIA
jgi:hypothetical protein